DASLDAEAILLLGDLIEGAGVNGARLRLSSLGTPETRRAYSDELRGYLKQRESELSDDVRARLERNPLRAFDSDHPGTQAVVAEAPKLIDRLADDDAEHFARVRSLLDAAGLRYEVDGTLVRGLDYYTRTVFEFTSDALGAQSGVGGGGRYNGLVEQLGGPPTPGVGWAAGVERILLAAGAEPREAAPAVFVAAVEGGSPDDAFLVRRALHEAGISAEMEQAGRSDKGQLKHAGRTGARVLVKVTAGGISVRDTRTGEERSAADRAAVVQAAMEFTGP
ncbi:MAG: histidyl-tRNA synthetase, partial [Thermoleophilaceae bacterium]|nr:histidyl-tRNA synthetase [Thermoleophilaceae bacterium]